MSRADTLTLSEHAAVSNKCDLQELESTGMQTPQRKVKNAVNAEAFFSFGYFLLLGEEINQCFRLCMDKSLRLHYWEKLL